MNPDIDNCATVVGGGLAGCEAACQLAKRGLRVTVHEMRYTGRDEPAPVTTPAHRTGLLAELVCSNSLKSVETANAHGLLKAELALLDSWIIKAAKQCAVPAGKALAVDRTAFARLVTEQVRSLPGVTIKPGEVAAVPAAPAVIASGPLTSDRLAADLARAFGAANLFFYDAIAPIVAADSLDHSKMFRASRNSDDGEYLNCPLTKQQYQAFAAALARAERHRPHGFEAGHYYEGCLPVEALAERNINSLRFGMMRPVGLFNPHEGRRPYAVVQLRRENAAGTMYNLVGFQTQLAWHEQRRVFALVPGLERAEYLRYGGMHRNTYLNAPGLLAADLQCIPRPGLFVAGQLTGVEGYVESAATGLVAGINLARLLAGGAAAVPPPTTMIGQLCRHVATAAGPYQPMNANFGLLPPLAAAARDKRERNAGHAERSLRDLRAWADANGI